MNSGQSQNLMLNMAIWSFMSVKNESLLVSRAISEVIDEVLLKENLNFDLFIVGDTRNRMSDIATGILASNNAIFATQVRIKSDLSFTEDIKQSSVFLLGNTNLQQNFGPKK